MKDTTAVAWRQLGPTDPQRLVDARLQLHWAVQPVAAFADARLQRLADDSQSNFGWRSDIGVLLGRHGPDGLAAALSVKHLRLMVFDAAETAVSSLPLAGNTLDDALTWLRGEEAGRTDGLPLRRRECEMPDHPVASGGPFTLEPQGSFEQLSRWFTVGNDALAALATSNPGWTEVRCWPHHFDLGAVISLEFSGYPSSGRSIGIGMSPGDASYAEPYFYVNPYGPESIPHALPPLPAMGYWHIEGWFGAVITGSQLLAHDDPAASLAGFLDGAFTAARGLLES